MSINFGDILDAYTLTSYDKNGKICMRQKPKTVEEAIYFANVDYINLNVCRLYLEEAGRLAKLNKHPALNELEKILAIDKNDDFIIAEELNILASKYKSLEKDPSKK